MKLFGLSVYEKKDKVNFQGTRTLRNTVSQLAKNNKYSLTEPNQRYITNSILKLGKISGEKNIKFLLNTAAKTTYSTNIRFKDLPKNDWKGMLLTAASSALAITPFINKTNFAKMIQELSKQNGLSEDEKQLIEQRENLLKAVDIKQIENETVGGIKDFEHNLDYFIVSSETTLAHKKYVLKRLNYFMSDNYKINPQLKDKKSIAVAEMINDMAIFTPGHKVPNIKAVNQKQHGMCAAISIVRKKLAYEDKPNYVDSIMSELDASEYIKVYDRSKLGSGKRAFFKKVPVDFEAALSKGYRIIDASTTQWMQLAGMSGYSGTSLNNYMPFDKANFDVKADSFYNINFQDEELSALQEYYQALIKASELMQSYKANKIKKNVKMRETQQKYQKEINAIHDTISLLSEKIGSKKIAREVVNLKRNFSNQIKLKNSFEYIENEEEVAKKEKIKRFILSKNPTIIIDDAKLSEIYDLVSYYHSLMAENIKSRKNPIKRANVLYEIAASNRYQFLKGFENDLMLKYHMLDKNIPCQETLMITTIDDYIKKIKEKSADSKLIIECLNSNTGETITSPKEAVNLLKQIKNDINTVINKEFDNFYSAIMLKNQKNAFVVYIKDLISSIENGKIDILDFVAERLNIKSYDDVIPVLNNMIKKIKTNSKKEFNRAYDILGNSSKISLIDSMWNVFLQKFSENDNEAFINDFIQSNKLDLTKNPDAINDILAEIEAHKISMELILEQYLNILDIFDKDGNIIYSARPVEHVMRKLENEGSVTSSKDLKALQVHLDKIQKDYSTDEFASRQGKLKDKSLYSFTNSEKATLDSIEKNINLIYKYIQKQFNYMQKYLKYPLEELKRIVGVDMGHWWVGKEGGSGLYTGQSIRVLEYITGKPHYSTTNIQDAIETIKKSPYSGITTSSVFHDRPGFHAQYVADIEPIEIKERSTTGKINIKTEEVLFQDNTWGASEHQNTWVDLNGQLRTDYSDNRGGTLGYITNDKYRNGNLVNRVIGDMVLEEIPETVENRVYKKITKNESREYKSPQYKDIIMEGKSPEANNVAESIHDALFVPSVNQIKIIKTFVKGMPEEQIKAKIKSIKYAMVNWESYYKRLLKRIKGIDNKHSILTEDDYNKLPNDDILKVKLEKAALKENYKITDKDPEIAKIKSVTDLNRFVKLQKQRAIKDFKYSFGKNINIVNYLLYSLDNSDIDKIDEILKKYGITLSDDKYNKIFNTNSITDKQFDGSIKNTINSLADNIMTKFDKEVKNEEAKNEIEFLLKRTFAKKIYFTTIDIDNPNISHIVEFIDRVYNPSDNAEFARIYRKIQNMTSKEFEDTVLSKVTNKDLNIKDFTGFSILKKIQRYEDKAEDILRNVVWADELYKVTEPSKHSIKYHPQKLYQKPSFVHNYNFDSSYREMKNDLSLLTLPKMFDKYKARNLDKYGVYPAYPKLECMSEEVFKYGFDTYIENIPELIAQIKDAKDLKEWLGYSDVLKNYMQKYRDNDVLSEKQFYELNKVFGKISTYIYDETSQDDIYKAAMSAMDIEKNSPFKNYKEYIKTIINKYEEYKKGCPIEGLDKQIEYNKTVLNKQTELFVKFFIRDRYQSDVYKTMQKYKNSLIRKSKTNDNQDLSKIYKEELWNEFHKYNILQQPDELLDKYIRSLASDSPLHEYESNYETLMNRALNYAMLYDVQSILMDALDEGVEMDVKSFFNDIEIPSADGTMTTMGSDKIIYNMVQSLVLDYQDETALKFLDKFGLNEIYVKESIKNFDFDELKNFIDEAYKVHRNYMEFEKKYNEIITKVYEKLDSGINPISTADKLKREFMQVLKTSNIDKTAAREFVKSLDNIAETCKENPQLKPKYVYNAVLTTAINELAKNMQDDTDEVNSMFDSTNVNAQIMNKLVLYDKSEAYKLRKAFNKKLSDLLDYQDNLYRSLEKDDDSNLYLQENQESVKI